MRSEHLGSYVSLFSCIDMLCMGALLSLVLLSDNRRQLKFYGKYWILPGAVTTLLVLWLFSESNFFGVPVRDIDFVLGKLPLGLLFCCLVYRMTLPLPGLVGHVASMGLLKYIGKISYGLYVYHPFIPYSLSATFLLIGVRWPSWLSGSSSFLVSAALAFCVATISWILLEKPVNNLRRLLDRAL